MVRAWIAAHSEAPGLHLEGVTSRGVEVGIVLSAVAPGVTRVQLMPAGATNAHVRLARPPTWGGVRMLVA
jgi:hypothetical protein